MRLIMGVARATMGVIEYMKTIGIDYMVYDDNQQRIGDLKDRYTASLDGIDEVITSPGFPPDHPLLKKAFASRLPIIDELEFTYQELDGRVIAITGTNGKSTTTALIGGILKDVKRVFIGGNIAPGRSYSQALLEPPYDYYILEVSSFQLERINTFHPVVAVITNISADHLNRHRTLEGYIATKFKIFANQDLSDHAILNLDDDLLRSRIPAIQSIKHYFSINAEAEGMIADGSVMINGQVIMGVDEMPIKGRYNQANVLIASLVTTILGLKPDQIRAGILSFTGLPFRMEKVAEKEGIIFINNSMCTNPTAAIASLSSVDRPYVVILGGSEKGVSTDEYLVFVARNARFAVIIGANRDHIAEVFEKADYKNFRISDSLDEAVKIALEAARPGWVVILNPGYASFDMFDDFEDRGRRFNDAVATI